MRTFSRSRKVLGSWPVMTGAVILAILTGFSTGRLIWRARSILSDRAATEARIIELERERDRLKASIGTAADPEVTERAAKETLNLRKPGEQVVVVKPPAPVEETVENAPRWWESIPWVGSFLKMLSQ
jgi:cell division protein FtsB